MLIFLSLFSRQTLLTRAHLAIGCSAVCAVCVVRAQSITQVDQEPLEKEPVFHAVPYGFFSESFGLGLGVGAVVNHFPRPESSLYGAVTLGTSGSYNVAIGGTQLRVPGFDRWVFRPLLMTARYQNQNLFVGNQNPGFEGQRAGAHGSDPDNNLAVTQWDHQANLEISYLLPMGHGRKEPVLHVYEVKDGELVSEPTGGEGWNPLQSGRTFAFMVPGWRKQTLDNKELNLPVETLNVQTGIRWDNRDYPFNPSRGNFVEISYQRDFLDQDTLGGWEAWFGEGEQLFDLGSSRASAQRVVALQAWAAYVPTWETDDSGAVVRRPPQYEGATLGGFYRLRGFESSRYQDKAAVVYAAEYRVIPYWQPLKEIEFLDWTGIRYWQWVLFAEAGRVAESWDLETLHEDMNADAGVSVRGMFYQAVCRLDFAFSEEGMQVVAMIGHPF